jgi:Rrf2 family protein
MRITTWTEYSLILAVRLARRAEEGLGPVSARALAEQERLPTDYAEQILLRLRRAEIISSVRGARGGYQLARPPADITVLDIMRVAEHQIFEINCEVHPVDDERCAKDASCTIRPVWRALRARVDDLLTQVTLADLLKEEAEVEVLVGL